ncbi:hypothetical protein WJX73_006904 [Symbiochloris irregularis]|uniref:LisH domain-containing protein n=1 Tax=Symbiochloris irregularis TaxID=706552 RepID=A0AAW1PRV5_9CHLO
MQPSGHTDHHLDFAVDKGIALLVLQWLHTQKYTQAAALLEREAGLDRNARRLAASALPLTQIVKEHRALKLRFEGLQNLRGSDAALSKILEAGNSRQRKGTPHRRTERPSKVSATQPLKRDQAQDSGNVLDEDLELATVQLLLKDDHAQQIFAQELATCLTSWKLPQQTQASATGRDEGMSWLAERLDRQTVASLLKPVVAFYLSAVGPPGALGSVSGTAQAPGPLQPPGQAQAAQQEVRDVSETDMADFFASIAYTGSLVPASHPPDVHQQAPDEPQPSDLQQLDATMAESFFNSHVYQQLQLGPG